MMQVFEFEDQKWFPNFIRESMTDYLRYVLNTTNFYRPTTLLLYDCLNQSNANICVDLCSGGGGPIESVIKNLKDEHDLDVRFILTDKFPNQEAFNFIKKRLPNNIEFIESSIDAMEVPAELVGVRTMYSAIHHFERETIKSVIQDAIKAKVPIAIFDGSDKSLLTIVIIIIFHPIAFFLFTPFFKPFKFSRILFTYIIPVIPFCTIWDGVVSILRLYQPGDLLKIVQEVDSNYKWKAGKVRNNLYMNITYLTGIPEK
ncbi:hypothetical protein C3K47_06165 [Solitalea longa]|uniref:Class I SAM-dependent methyltransferase n=1 Tax=Solitalea longa TaxID=2079460 RepID=A0A2S5A4X7_9SPHI|nr:hypothetical protein [Solitalea longa]POY37347.1 hypothetical protein C3K47_06165 [Solitalea longa]